jgi:hypothetical protein
MAAGPRTADRAAAKRFRDLGDTVKITNPIRYLKFE